MIRKNLLRFRKKLFVDERMLNSCLGKFHDLHYFMIAHT